MKSKFVPDSLVSRVIHYVLSIDRTHVSLVSVDPLWS